VNDRLRQTNPLGHALRVGPNPVAAPPSQPDALEGLGNATPAFGRVYAGQPPVQVEQLGARQPVMKAKILGQVTDSPPGFGIADGLAEQARLAAARRNQAQQDLDRRRLAGAVGAQKAEDFTRLDDQVQPVQRDLAAVLLAESDRLDSGSRQRTARLSATRFRAAARRVPATPYR